MGEDESSPGGHDLSHLTGAAVAAVADIDTGAAPQQQGVPGPRPGSVAADQQQAAGTRGEDGQPAGAGGGDEQPPAEGEQQADPLAALPAEMRERPEGECYPDIQVAAAGRGGARWQGGPRVAAGMFRGAAELRKPGGHTRHRHRASPPVTLPPLLPFRTRPGARGHLAAPAAHARQVHQPGDPQEQVLGASLRAAGMPAVACGGLALGPPSARSPCCPSARRLPHNWTRLPPVVLCHAGDTAIPSSLPRWWSTWRLSSTAPPCRQRCAAPVDIGPGCRVRDLGEGPTADGRAAGRAPSRSAPHPTPSPPSPSPIPHPTACLRCLTRAACRPRTIWTRCSASGRPRRSGARRRGRRATAAWSSISRVSLASLLGWWAKEGWVVLGFQPASCVALPA